MSLTGARLAARLARREVSRRPWRTLLIALLVAGPVAGMTVAVVLVRTEQLSPLERWRLSFGQADAILSLEGGMAVADQLPSGSRAVGYQVTYRLARTSAGRQAHVEVNNLPVSDPLAEGIVNYRGRAPERAGEVLISERTSEDLDIGIGDRVVLERPIAAEVTVVGIGARADTRSAGLLVRTCRSRAAPHRACL